MITIHMQPTEPDKIRFTLLMTMSLAEWKGLKDGLSSANESGMVLKNAIRDMIGKSEKEFANAVITDKDEE
jgi:hypothetical protein